LRGLVLASTLLLLCVGCGGDAGGADRSGRPVGNLDEQRTEVERYKRFGLYYLGESFDGFALSRVLSDRDPWRTVSFIYGDCEPPRGGDGGCAPPLEIQNDPACRRTGRKGPAPVARFQIQGVPAAGFSAEVEEVAEGGEPKARDQNGSLEMYTGWTTITIFGGGQNRMRRAAGAIRPLSVERVGSRLPPPSREALEGRATCAEQGAMHAE
jgi:hypothetical protein